MMRPRTKRAPDDPRNGPVFLRRQLLDQGYDDKTIARMVRRGEWVRVRHGAYADAQTWDALDEAGRHGLRARAVLQQGRTELIVSHASALPEYDAPTWGIDLSEVHVTRPDGRAGRREAGVRQHAGRILDGDVVLLNGLPVMSATRAALEVTLMAKAEAALVVINHLLHVGETTIEALAVRYESMEQWPNSLRTDLVLRLANPQIESIGESRSLFLCFMHGLPMPEVQYPIRDSAGRIVARVDFAWPELGVFLEFDGKVKYEALLREGQRASDVVVAEKRREELICRLTGWRCIRIVWADLEHPERTVAMIRSVLFPVDRAA